MSTYLDDNVFILQLEQPATEEAWLNVRFADKQQGDQSRSFSRYELSLISGTSEIASV